MDMIKKRAAMRGQGGFTLVELLVAVAILAILAGVAVFAVGNLTSQSGVAACRTEGDTLRTAAQSAEVTGDPVSTYLEGTLKYFNAATGARINTAEVPDVVTGSLTADDICEAVTLP